MDIAQMIFLGLGLSMDAASVSMSDGMMEKTMSKKKMFFIAFLFGFFQGFMPMLGYFAGSFFSSALFYYIPWIAFFLLIFLGGKMIYESVMKKNNEEIKTTFSSLFLQAIATSIDALTTGIIYVGKEIYEAILAFSIVAGITFLISFVAILIGKKFGEVFKNKATLFGGIILIGIGIKILVESFLA